MGGDPSSPVGSAACYGGMGTSGSRVMNQLLQSLCLSPYMESMSLLKKVIAVLRKEIINLDVDIGVKQRIYD